MQLAEALRWIDMNLVVSLRLLMINVVTLITLAAMTTSVLECP